MYIVDNSSLDYQLNSVVVRALLTMMTGQRARADSYANEFLSEVEAGAIRSISYCDLMPYLAGAYGSWYRTPY